MSKKTKKWGVITPGESFKKQSKTSLDKIKYLFLEELGVELNFGKHIFKQDLMHSTSLENRVEDINLFVKNQNISALICGNGGFNSIEILDAIDWKKIKKNKTQLFGSSDATVFINALYSQTKNTFQAFHCPNLWRFGFSEMVEPTIKALNQILNRENYNIHKAKKWSDEKWYLKSLEERVFNKGAGLTIIQPGEAKGRIIGGNLCSLNLLQGTKYFPDFKQDIVLFLEEDSFVGEYTFEEFSRNLNSLILSLRKSNIVGLIIGRFQRKSEMNIKKMKFIIKKIPRLKNIPIICNADISHTYPSIPFPIGANVSLSANNSDANIKILF